MRLEPVPGQGGPTVTGFGAGGFRVGTALFPALLMTVDAVGFWMPPPLDALAPDDLRPLIDARPEFVLLGTGAALRRPPFELVRALDEGGIGLEAMDSRAAARAWGVLRGEGRIVAMALYPLT